jgi:argininosuccinate lyase
MKLWGGNYSGDPDRGFWEFNRSLPVDRRLVEEEIAASRAYVRALARASCLPAEQATRLDAALAGLLERVLADPSLLDREDEDIHSFVEARLQETVGELASQAHLGRSRNEQAVTALRLWILKAIDQLGDGITALVETLAEKGHAGSDAVMPGFTHTRRAEPITFGHLAAAHAWGLVRDLERLGDARRRVDVLPLGSGALAGTALPLDREALAQDLGFGEISPNALDAVTDRDFAAEFVFACAQTQTHLARLAEDLIWLSAPEYGFFALPEAFTTGSSLMPQKKNPDALELVRGKSARVDADLLRLLALMKGLPSGYQKDLQEDKEAIFDAADTTAASLAVMGGVVKGLTLGREKMESAARHDELMAASLAVALAQGGMPFRKAHGLVGELVAEAEKTGSSLREVAASELPAHAPWIVARISAIFDPRESVRSKVAWGGTSPGTVKASLDAALARVSSPRAS